VIAVAPVEPAMLGIDLGTSQVKALVCSRGGEVLGTGIAGYSVRAPRPGWAETDPADWWRATAAAVTAAVGEAGTEVTGLAVAGQMHGVVLAGASGDPLRPAIVWLDRRSSAEVGEYRRMPPGLLAALGNPPAPGMAGPTAAWLARHEPDRYRQARWLLQPKDWLRLRLTGEAASDPTDASGTLLYDMTRQRWAADVADALGLRTDLLPPVRRPAEIAGSLQAGAASELGLPAGLPVAVGAGDTAASLLAAALPGPGWGMLTLGTGGQWVVPVTGAASSGGKAHPGGKADPSGKTNLFFSADGGEYRLAAVQNVGITLGWVNSVLRTSWADLYDTAASPWRPGTPVFLPYLASERGDEAAAGGAWEELSLGHERDDLLRAALEGVAFLLRAKLGYLRDAGCYPEKAVIAGGGSRHPSWRRLLADVLQLPLYAASTPWLSVRGATLIAGVATGIYPTFADAASRIPPPEPAAGAGHSDPAEERYQRFRRLRNRR
jgi:xylulokinase